VLRRLLWTLCALVAAWVVLSLVLFLWSPWNTGAPARADAVVVLSGGRERLPPGMDLVRRGVAPVLAISSVQETPNWRQARELCAAGRYEQARVTCFLADPFSTRGEARTVARLARRRHWRSIVVVTSTFHLTRAKLLFGRCYDGRTAWVGSTSPWWRLPEEWALETSKLAVQLTTERAC
jgi:uncharacterized SAM-binding protein YcdF (DUF218 family)